VNVDRHQRVMKLFQQALDRPLTERDAFLRETCGNDHNTLEEVRSLLKYHDPRTIAPTILSLPDASAGSQQARNSWPSQLRNFRPTDPNRLRASLIALTLATLLAALGYWLDRQIEMRLRENLASQMLATLDSNVAAVTNWLLLEQHQVAGWAASPNLQERFIALLAAIKSPSAPLEALGKLAAYDDLVDMLTPLVDDTVRAINVTNKDGKMLATSRLELREEFRLTPFGRQLIAPVFRGQEIILPPMLGSTLVENPIPGISDVPILIVGCPIRDGQKHVIGGLFATIESGNEFTRLLDLGRVGPGGDTYAFGRQGELLSASQYEDQLQEIGLLKKSTAATSVLQVQLRDPGVDLTAGQKKDALPLSRRPLTRMVTAANALGDGIDLDGYRDYRGVWVVGAWKWLKPFGFGVAIEIEYDDAYSVLNFVRRVMWSLFGLLVLVAGVAYLSSLSAFRLRREMGVVRQLGQYTLEKLIGTGGMGKVYKARHAFLRRPTAVKVLDGQDAGAAGIARFEREVQLASALTHPNTVEIFDYGRTNDGIFYYAMEYLPGITLEGLVRRDGAIGAPRVLHILRQVLGSITEAHEMGLIHRDIKPANIILCRRGGMADFVKVVDFGLAKDLSFNLAPQITQTGLISGTPLYIAPELLDDPASASPLSDIYAIAAVAFYLLTGRELFTGQSPLDVLRKVGYEHAPRASNVTTASIPPEIDELIAQCVAKDPAARPASTRQILAAAERLSLTYVWTVHEAEEWWAGYDRELASNDSFSAVQHS
jgi:hypothetical protein